MSAQFLIPLAEWKTGRFGFPITNATLAKYGELGHIIPKPEKIGGKWRIDRDAVYVGPGGAGVAPEIYDDDDDTLKGILTHVTEATKK